MKSLYKLLTLTVLGLGIGVTSQTIKPVHAASYYTILRSRNTTYNARLVNQATRNDGIYTAGPYDTSRSTTSPDRYGRNWNHAFVHVTAEATTVGGTYAKFSYYGKQIGWVNVQALQHYSLNQHIKDFEKAYHFRGNAEIIQNYHQYAAPMGWARYGKRIANSTTTEYPILSLQKVITGAMITQLVAENRIGMDTRLKEFYPAVPNSDNITIRQMLNMESGIQMHEETPNKVLTEKQSFQFALDKLSANHPQSFSYTNANYTLLAGIITKLTGKTYQQNFEERIVQKLGLQHTFYWNQVPTNVPVALSYYHINNRNYQYQPLSRALMSSLTGSGNVYTTPSDYYQIQRGLRNGQILSRDQYYLLRNDYNGFYLGGMYHATGAVKYVHGSIARTGFDNFWNGSEGNKNGVAIFANQIDKDPSKITTSKFISKLQPLVKYY